MLLNIDLFYYLLFSVFAVNGYTTALRILTGCLPFRPHNFIRALKFRSEQMSNVLSHDGDYPVDQPNCTMTLSKPSSHRQSSAFNPLPRTTLLTPLDFTFSVLCKSEVHAWYLAVSAHAQRVGIFWDDVPEQARGFLFAGSSLHGHTESPVSFCAHSYMRRLSKRPARTSSPQSRPFKKCIFRYRPRDPYCSVTLLPASSIVFQS